MGPDDVSTTHFLPSVMCAGWDSLHPFSFTQLMKLRGSVFVTDGDGMMRSTGLKRLGSVNNSIS